MNAPTVEAIERNLPDDMDDVSDVDELFAVLAEKLEEPEIPAETPEPQTAAPEASPPPAEPAQPAPEAPSSTAPTPEQPPAQPAAAQQVPAAPVAAPMPPPEAPAPAAPAPVQPEMPKPPSEAELKAAFDKQRDELVKVYALTEEDARAVVTEPETVLPKLAANLHQAIFSQIQRSLAEYLPAVIQQATEARARQADADNRFYGRWPSLRGHEQTVLQVGQMYRQANPTAPPEKAIEQIGQIVSLSLGLPMATPTAPVQPPAAPPAHRPAAATGVPASPVPAAPNEWTAFADDDIADRY